MTLKQLFEKRNELHTAMTAILGKMDTEKRTEMLEDEKTAFDNLDKEIRAVEDTITRVEKVRSFKIEEGKDETENRTAEERALSDKTAFANYIKRECGVFVEQRSGEQNVTIGNNGAVIPTTIANIIINTVKEMSPIFEKATMFNVKGTLKVPVWGLANTTHDIAVGYQAEFTDITADSGKFTSVDLTGYLAGALALIGKSVVNNSGIDVVGFVIREISMKIALFLEKELLVGTSSYATGALATTTSMVAGSTTVISADNLIDLQAKVPSIYQATSAWYMKTATFTSIRKLKDGNGQYLLQPGLAGSTPFQLLGKPVYLSDNMPAIGSANKAVLYGDASGLGVNMREDISIQVLLEKYATQHAIGIVAWFEFDSNVIDHQKLATLVMSVS